MDSSDYTEIDIHIEPFSDEIAEILEAEVSEIGFDAFMIEEPSAKCYIQSDILDEHSLKAILETLSTRVGASFTYEAHKMPQINWNATWEQEGFTPIVVNDTVAIIPEGAISSFGTRHEIYLAANMAFGTGHHHTTFMMMETMADIEDIIKGAHVTDLGCGTAVLAILAAKMGADAVDAIDIDAVAARSAKDNVQRNGCDKTVNVRCGDASLLGSGCTDILLANIHKNIILADIDRYARAIRNNGFLLISGFYDTDCEDIIEKVKDAGFVPATDNPDNWMRIRENWACLKFRKES